MAIATLPRNGKDRKDIVDHQRTNRGSVAPLADTWGLWDQRCFLFQNTPAPDLRNVPPRCAQTRFGMFGLITDRIQENAGHVARQDQPEQLYPGIDERTGRRCLQSGTVATTVCVCLRQPDRNDRRRRLTERSLHIQARQPRSGPCIATSLATLSLRTLAAPSVKPAIRAAAG